MADLSPESKEIYYLLMAETREAYEERFLAHKKQILDSVRTSVDETKKQFKAVHESVDAIHDTVGTEIAEARASLGMDLEKVQTKLSAGISKLSAAVDRATRSTPATAVEGAPAPQTWRPGSNAVGPDGHRSALQLRGTACDTHTPPPGGGTISVQKLLSPISPSYTASDSDPNSSAPRVELPQFDGANPKLWQRRCEEYFCRWNTSAEHWVSYGSSQFTGAAATCDAFDTDKTDLTAPTPTICLSECPSRNAPHLEVALSSSATATSSTTTTSVYEQCCFDPEPAAAILTPTSALDLLEGRDINATDLAAVVPSNCPSECPSHDVAVSVPVLNSYATQTSSTTTCSVIPVLNVDVTGDTAPLAVIGLPGSPVHSISREDPMSVSLTPWNLPKPPLVTWIVSELFTWSPTPCSTDCSCYGIETIVPWPPPSFTHAGIYKVFNVVTTGTAIVPWPPPGYVRSQEGNMCKDMLQALLLDGFVLWSMQLMLWEGTYRWPPPTLNRSTSCIILNLHSILDNMQLSGDRKVLKIWELKCSAVSIVVTFVPGFQKAQLKLTLSKLSIPSCFDKQFLSASTLDFLLARRAAHIVWNRCCLDSLHCYLGSAIWALQEEYQHVLLEMSWQSFRYQWEAAYHIKPCSAIQELILIKYWLLPWEPGDDSPGHNLMENFSSLATTCDLLYSVSVDDKLLADRYGLWCMRCVELPRIRPEAYYPLPGVNQGRLKWYGIFYVSNSCGMCVLHDGSNQDWILSSSVGLITQYGSLTRLSPHVMCLNLQTAPADAVIIPYLHCKGPQDTDEIVCVASRYLVVISTTRTEGVQPGARADKLHTHKFYSTKLSSWESTMLVGKRWILMICHPSEWNSFEMELVLDCYCQVWDSSYCTRLLFLRAHELMPWKIPWPFSFPLYMCSCQANSVWFGTSTILSAGKFGFHLRLYSSCDQFGGNGYLVMHFTVKSMGLQPTKVLCCRFFIQWPGVLISARASFFETLQNATQILDADICGQNWQNSTKLQNPSCWTERSFLSHIPMQSIHLLGILLLARPVESIGFRGGIELRSTEKAFVIWLVMLWDPGGSTWCRLEVKPKFKEGGLSTTSLLGWSVGRYNWAMAYSGARQGRTEKHICEEDTYWRLGLERTERTASARRARIG